MKNIFDLVIVPVITFAISTILAIVFKDNFLGVITLACGFLNAYYLAKGKWYNYIYGFVFSVSYGVACALNGLYGWGIFVGVFYIPSQIYGMINWFKQAKNDPIEMRSLKTKSAVLVCASTVVGSVLFGFLLSLIPTQQLSFLDSTTQIVNVAGIVLSLFRWREAWYVWIINNVLDLSIWTVNLFRGNENAWMMFITSIMYLIMNVVGVISWIKIEREQKNQKIVNKI